MKLKALLAVAALACAQVLSAADAQITEVRPNRGFKPYTTPFSLNIATPVGLPWGFDWNVTGLQIGLYNQITDLKGLQIGCINVTDRVNGVQIGGINYTHDMRGLQIGFLNIIEDSDLPFFPVINAWF